MSGLDDDSNTPQEPPLWSIGIAVLVILLAPLVLYSIAPNGPLREGDTVFSQGQQRVIIHTTPLSQTTPETCLLDPDNPLIVLQSAVQSPGQAIVARVQGAAAAEWPFCRPQSEVLLAVHQVYQKPNLVARMQRIMEGWLGR